MAAHLPGSDRDLGDGELAGERDRSKAAYFDGGLLRADVGIFFEGGVVSTLLKAQPFERLGALSYSIYMVHAMVLFAVTLGLILVGKVTGYTVVTYDAAAPGPMLSFKNAVADNLLLIGLLILIVRISAVSHQYIELRGIEWGRRLSRRGLITSPTSQIKTVS